MKKVVLFLLAAALCVAPVAAFAQAHDDHSHGMSAGPSISAAMVTQMKDAQSKLVELAEATPAEKYMWRPAEGVRSTAEVFLHVATANYGIPYLMGTTPPEGIDVMGLEKSTSDKKKIVETLKASFAHAISAVESTPATDYGKTFKFFDGSEMSTLDGLMVLVSHGHEHLGQSIAYARSNGIVPPWTARQEAAMKEAQKKSGDKADE